MEVDCIRATQFPTEQYLTGSKALTHEFNLGVEVGSESNLKSATELLFDKSNQALDDFVSEVNEAGLQRFVKGAFYDSQSDVCTIKFRDDFIEFEHFLDQLLTIARRTLKRFDWFGVIQRGVPPTVVNLTWYDH